MYSIQFTEIYTDKKICLCGCGKTIKEENWGLKIKIEGEVNSVDECFEIVEKFEKEIDKIKCKTIVCKYCGNCCDHGPELSSKELTYLLKKYPEYENLYKKIIPCTPCALGGKNKGPCALPNYARPLQCRILFCEANIIGFESLYNLMGRHLNWTILSSLL